MSNYTDDASDDPDKGERKRQREKQRRCDLANAFDELQATLNRVGLGSDVYGRPMKADLNSETPVTRLGLILQTTEALQRLHQENMHMRLTLGGPWTDDGSVRQRCRTFPVRQRILHSNARCHSFPRRDRGDRSMELATTTTRISKPPTTKRMVIQNLTIRPQHRMAPTGTTLPRRGNDKKDEHTIVNPLCHRGRQTRPMALTGRQISHLVVCKR